MPQKKDDNFISPEFIPVFHCSLVDENLQKQDCLVLGAVYWFERLKDGKCFASNLTLAKVIGATNSKSVTNSLRRLEENGYIKCIYKDINKRHRKQIVCSIHRLHKKKSHPQMEPEPSTDGTVSTPEPSTDGQNKNNTYKEQKKNIGEVILLFRDVNPSYENFYRNKTERGAVERLLIVHGFEKLAQVIRILPKTNTMKYVPTITSPYQLEAKWSQLEAALRRKKAEHEVKKPKVAFI